MDSTNVEYITRLVIQALGENSAEGRMSVPVGVSARHIHLCQADVERLFGQGYQLT
ncbi:MAG: phosphate propanoyltransferase, partial [Lachnospiraceae bacterium]|nr:phosphate propanoyltransferase [Lachnospiraceae bacterium]